MKKSKSVSGLQKGASGKGPRQKASKCVKHIFDTFRHFFAKGKNRQKVSRRTQGGCGGLRQGNPGAFPKARPILQQPFSIPENAQTLAGIAFRAAGKSAKNFPAALKFCRKSFPARNFGQPQPSRVF